MYILLLLLLLPLSLPLPLPLLLLPSPPSSSSSPSLSPFPSSSSSSPSPPSSSSSPGSPDCSFLLSVLPESPSHMLGRLVFEQSIKPHHLEGLMGEFPHLQIVEVLVKCCCPHVPSSAVLPVVTRMPRPPRPAVVALNECGVGGGAAGINTCGLACDLLSKLITLLKGSVKSVGGSTCVCNVYLHVLCTHCIVVL